MAAVFLSKSVRYAHSAKPSFLRPLLWAIGVQAALGGTLVMIHDKVFLGEEEKETVAVTMSFVDEAEDSASSGIKVNRQIRVILPAVVPVRMEEEQSHKEMPLLSVNQVPVPDGIPNTEKSDGLSFDNEEFGTLLRREGGTDGARGKQSGKSKGRSSLASNLTAASETKSNSAATSARYKSAPLPPYPRSARSEGREGVVMLKLLIDEEGTPIEVCLAKSSGSSVLDDAALEWVKNNWLFYPATDGMVPVESAMIAPLRFKLNS